jgi:hypothetical protein
MIIDFEGQQHQFPDDFNDADIAKALGRAPRAPKQTEDVTAGMALRGVPVLGAYVPQAEAAIRAAAQPLTGVGQPGANWRERYEANLPEQEAQYTQAERESPITSEALKLGGGIAATGALGATGAGARALGMAGGLPSRLAMSTGSGALLSGADVAARGGSAEDIKEATKWGAGVGAASVPLAAGVSRLISPFVARDPTRQAAVETFREAGGQPTAGQVTGSRPLQWAEQQLGEFGGRGPETRLTAAALKSIGEDAERATPAVINRASERIGGEFDRLGMTHTLQPDVAMGPQIRKAISDYERVVPQSQQSGSIRAYESDIAQSLAQNKNTLPGEAYQNLRSAIETDARGADPKTANALREIRGALDSAMERQLIRTRDPDAGAWQKARDQYRNLLVLEHAAANPNTRLGVISPAALYSANKNVQGIRNIARGRGELTPLAQAGSDILREMPSSGTVQRAYVMGIPAALGGVAGGIYGGDPWSAGYGALAGLAGPPLAGRALMNPLMQRYLANQAMAGRAGAALRGGTLGGLLDLVR